MKPGPGSVRNSRRHRQGFLGNAGTVERNQEKTIQLFALFLG
jgi:hypothetical protein